MISDELKAGIEAYYRRIDALGGFGSRVSARAIGTMGRTVTGTLGERVACQPYVTTSDGRRFVIDLGTAGPASNHADEAQQ
jgi:hypothetical protein